jgi:signal transduction histidine kinase
LLLFAGPSSFDQRAFSALAGSLFSWSGFSVLRPRNFQLRRPSGTSLLVVFLLVTLGLSLWLGYQALDAARSHRRTAEAVMADYAGMAAWEYARFARERLDEFYRWVFDDIPWTLRRRPPSPEVMANDFRSVLRSQGCDCRDLLDRAWFFRVDLQDGSATSEPETVDEAILEALGETILVHRESEPDSRTGLLTLDAGALLEPTSLVIYLVSTDSDGGDRLAYGVVADSDAFGELFLQWYRSAPLLPTIIASGESRDSLLQLSVRGPTGLTVFESPVPYPGPFSSTDTLEVQYGSLIVGAAIRPDAAPRLIIGGLPRSRIPLLLGLMLLTLGVGAAALIQLRREHKLARLRDDFISGVSHEFRTPLTQIRVFAELLDGEKLRTQEERRRSTRVINREARRLTHLVENILQFSRVSRLPTSLGDLEEIDLAATLEELSEAFAPQAAATDARLQIAVTPELAVVAGRGGMHQILANLLDNALKYGPPGQTVQVQAFRNGDTVRISVEDEGPGIPPRDRKRIWDPYRRLDRDVKGEVQGSGIGLAVVKELCPAYGGRVWVEDGERGGARFVVELPAARLEEEATGPASEEKE